MNGRKWNNAVAEPTQSELSRKERGHGSDRGENQREPKTEDAGKVSRHGRFQSNTVSQTLGQKGAYGRRAKYHRGDRERQRKRRGDKPADGSRHGRRCK